MQHDIVKTRAKHIDIRYHFIRDAVRDKKIVLQYWYHASRYHDEISNNYNP